MINLLFYAMTLALSPDVFLGGTYPDFTPPPPRATPPAASVCTVTNVEYGAVGNGVADDTHSIRQVITRGSAHTIRSHS